MCHFGGTSKLDTICNIYVVSDILVGIKKFPSSFYFNLNMIEENEQAGHQSKHHRPWASITDLVTDALPALYNKE